VYTAGAHPPKRLGCGTWLILRGGVSQKRLTAKNAKKGAKVAKKNPDPSQAAPLQGSAALTGVLRFFG